MNTYAERFAPTVAMARTAVKIGACVVASGGCALFMLYASLMLVVPDYRFERILDWIDAYPFVKSIVLISITPFWIVIGVSKEAAILVALRAYLMLGAFAAGQGLDYCWNIVSAWWEERKRLALEAEEV